MGICTQVSSGNADSTGHGVPVVHPTSRPTRQSWFFASCTTEGLTNADTGGADHLYGADSGVFPHRSRRAAAGPYIQECP